MTAPERHGPEEALREDAGRGSLWSAILVDIAVGLLWAVMLALAVLFISGVSQFIYVDF